MTKQPNHHYFLGINLIKLRKQIFSKTTSRGIVAVIAATVKRLTTQ